MINAVIYARYSSYNQTEQSIDGQLRVCREFAKREDYNIINEYIDRARTGTNDDRPAFQKMLRDSEEHLFTCVIVYQLDRFARNRRDSVNNKFFLKKNGVKVVSATEPITDTPENIIIEGFFEDIAEYYSVDLSKKAKRGINESVIKRQTIGGHLLYGYKTENMKIVINEDEAKFVRIYFEERAKRKPIKEIIHQLNLMNAPLRNGKPLSPKTFQHAEKNRKYIGEFMFHDELITDMYPAIVDKALFDKVQSVVVKNKHSNRAKIDYLLTGKMFCGHCGAPMVGWGGTSKSGKAHHYYICNKRLKTKDCEKVTERKDFIEYYICEQTITYLLSGDRVDYIAERILKEASKDPTKREIDTLQRNIDKLNNEIDVMTNDYIGAPSRIQIRIKEKLEIADRELTDLENSLIRAKTKNKFKIKKEDIVAWLTMYSHYDLTDEKIRLKIITNFVNSVYLYNDHVIIYFNIGNSQHTSYLEMLEDSEQLDEDNNSVRIEGKNGGAKGI